MHMYTKLDIKVNCARFIVPLEKGAIYNRNKPDNAQNPCGSINGKGSAVTDVQNTTH